MALHPAVEALKSRWPTQVNLSGPATSDRSWLDCHPGDESPPPLLVTNPLQGRPIEHQASRARVVDADPSKFSTVLLALGKVSDHLMHWADSTHSIATTIQFKARETKCALVAYERRIDELEEQAQPYGYSLRIGSKAAFLLFLDRMPQLRRAGLVLMENGNLRAIWKGENGSHLGLQFIGTESIQYVIFRRRRLGSSMSRVTGRDSIDGIIRQIDAFDLHGILNT